jgi:hypothetical protein
MKNKEQKEEKEPKDRLACALVLVFIQEPKKTKGGKEK